MTIVQNRNRRLQKQKVWLYNFGCMLRPFCHLSMTSDYWSDLFNVRHIILSSDPIRVIWNRMATGRTGGRDLAAAKLEQPNCTFQIDPLVVLCTRIISYLTEYQSNRIRCLTMHSQNNSRGNFPIQFPAVLQPFWPRYSLLKGPGPNNGFLIMKVHIQRQIGWMYGQLYDSWNIMPMQPPSFQICTARHFARKMVMGGTCKHLGHPMSSDHSSDPRRKQTWQHLNHCPWGGTFLARQAGIFCKRLWGIMAIQICFCYWYGRPCCSCCCWITCCCRKLSVLLAEFLDHLQETNPPRIHEFSSNNELNCLSLFFFTWLRLNEMNWKGFQDLLETFRIPMITRHYYFSN